MSTLVLGDIHGRKIWDQIVKENSNVDHIVFLGDYVSTHENIYAEQQLSNLEDILDFKTENPDKVILLRGNHDIQHCNYYWAECSGYDRTVGKLFPKEKFLELTQWIYIQDNILFSHAGVSQVWLDWSGFTLDNINEQPPSEKFAFNGGPWDMYGNSETQPPTWIRPDPLYKCAVKDYIHVVGHTPVNKDIFNVKDINKEVETDIWLCDALDLGQYLLIENDEFKICKIS